MNFATTTELAAALQARKLSATELLEQSIARIEAHDAKINAVVVRDFERARRAAAAADAQLARGERRPLLGVPITVKEAFNVAGLPTTWGIAGTERVAVREDAVAVTRLKQAGAVLIGKTNVPTHLADFQTYNAIYGVTNNPWDLGRTPGGSSGGSAAALAAGFVSLELGSDLGGSLRMPAHCCGVLAHRPTHGIVPMRGFAPPGTPVLSVSADVDLAVVGPMARSAADLAAALDVLAGPDDARAVAYRLELPPPRHAHLREFRVLVLDQHPWLPTSNDVRAAIARFADNLHRAGAKVERKSALLPDLAQLTATFTQLLASFVGADMPAAEYRALQKEAARLRADDPSPASAWLRSAVLSHRDWIHADRVRVGIAHQWRQLFREFDVAICPVLPIPAFEHNHAEMETCRIEIDGQSVPYVALSQWSAVSAVGGLPSTAMPIGLSPRGLPIGVQVVGPYLEDRTTLGFAQLAEREFGGFTPPPQFATSSPGRA
jgi:amidase